jgi:hypothetical protein
MQGLETRKGVRWEHHIALPQAQALDRAAGASRFGKPEYMQSPIP